METITYRYFKTDIGDAMIAGADKVQFLHFGSSKKRLLQNLKLAFRKAKLTENKRAFTTEVKQLTGYLAGQTPGINFPIAVSGTDFQEQVWEYLQTIPPGTTQSYQEVARAIGSPLAARAVASACARNDVALAVPCHRVVRSDGSLSEYRWGKDRKQAILHLESRK